MQALRSLSPLKLVASTLALLALVLALAAPALADPGGYRGYDGPNDDDRVALSGPIDVPAGQTVAGDVVAFNGPVRVAGTANGDVVAMNGPIDVSGSVNGDVVGLSDRVTLAPGAAVNGDLVYGSGERPTVPAGATVSGEIHAADGADQFFQPLGAVAAWLGVWLAVSLSSLALGLVLLRLAPKSAEQALEIGLKRIGPSIGLGLAVLVGVPVAAVTLMITIIGIPLGIALLLALVPLYAIGYTISAWVLGRVVTKPERRPFVAFLAGWGILRAVALVPFLGALGGLAATVFGLGVLVLLVQRARGSAPPAPVEPTPAPA